MPEKLIPIDANKEIDGQPWIVFLDKSFNEEGLAVIYKQYNSEPQVGREVQIYGENCAAMIIDVEKDPVRGYKITLQRLPKKD